MRCEITTLELLGQEKHITGFRAVCVVEQEVKIEITGKLDETLNKDAMLRVINERLSAGLTRLFNGIEFIFKTQFASTLKEV